jgi:hypothetical protein
MNVRIFWGIVTIASTVWLFIYVLMYIVPLWKFWLEIWDLLYRITITSPLVFLIGFSAWQYWSETKKSDKYAFKAVTASSISHHTEFLKKEFPKNNEEVLSFATDTFTKIYREPYEDNPDLKKDLLKLENSINKEILLKKGWDTSLEKIVATAKELRNMFPNDDTLQWLIEYLKNPKNK